MDKEKQDIEAVLKVLHHQAAALGNVAAGILVTQYRLHGEWNEAQAYQAQRIMSELAVAKRRAERAMEERDVVGKAAKALDAAQARLDRLAQLRARMKTPR